MIKLDKLSPSSISKFSECEMKWFLSYILGYREPSGKAAIKGTASHYVMECIAQAKLLAQNGEKDKSDKVVGKIEAGNYEIDKWIDDAYNHFCLKDNNHKWEAADKKEVTKGVNKAVQHEFCPANHAEIISPERYFAIPIMEDWAEYYYLDSSGEVASDRLKVNGVIDVVYRDNDGTINYLDYKFGKPKDWNSGEEKNFFTLQKDVQLCLYYWAIKNLFKEENINTHIWYVHHDKLYSLFFDETHIELAMNKVKEIFLKIKGLYEPKRNICFKCNWCEYKKTSFKQWGRPELDVAASDNDKFGSIDGSKTVCDAMAMFLDTVL